jgi:hypothetical protein
MFPETNYNSTSINMTFISLSIIGSYPNYPKYLLQSTLEKMVRSGHNYKQT